MGGNAVWGDLVSAPDDLPGNNASFGRAISFRAENGSALAGQNLTVEDALQYLMEKTEPWYSKTIHRSYSHGVAHTAAHIEKNMQESKFWVNPLESRLPNAPSMTIFCLYGIGRPTERGYLYRQNQDPSGQVESMIDSLVTIPGIDHGVALGEGDGTVNLLSLGYMCNKAWKDIPRYNPGGIKIKVVESPHRPDRFVVQNPASNVIALDDADEMPQILAPWRYRHCRPRGFPWLEIAGQYGPADRGGRRTRFGGEGPQRHLGVRRASQDHVSSKGSRSSQGA